MTKRTDVTWTDGVAYCDTCNYCVDEDGQCGPDCMQSELARVVAYIRRKQQLARTVAKEELQDLLDELAGGAHR